MVNPKLFDQIWGALDRRDARFKAGWDITDANWQFGRDLEAIGVDSERFRPPKRLTRADIDEYLRGDQP